MTLALKRPGSLLQDIDQQPHRSEVCWQIPDASNDLIGQPCDSKEVGAATHESRPRTFGSWWRLP